MTSLTNLYEDYRAYGFLGNDNEFYSVYFNFWIPYTLTCASNESYTNYQSCLFRGGIFYQIGYQNTLEFSSFNNSVKLSYGLPMGTPCQYGDEGCYSYNNRSTEFVIDCDHNVDNVTNVSCTQLTAYHYQCQFRHSSACLIYLPPNATAPVPSYYPMHPSPSGEIQLVFYDYVNSRNDTIFNFDITGLAYQTYNSSFIGIDGNFYQMYFSFGYSNTDECGDSLMPFKGFYYQSCQKSGAHTYQMGNPYLSSYTVQDFGFTINYTIDSFAAEYSCATVDPNLRRSRRIGYNFICFNTYEPVIECNETSFSCVYECNIYSIYGCSINSTTNSSTTYSPITGIYTSTTGEYTTGEYNSTTGNFTSTTGGYTTGGYNTTTGGYNSTTGGYSTTTTSSSGSSSTTSTTSHSSGSSSEESYFNCSWRTNGFIVSSNQHINCSSEGVTICITNDGSRVSIPSGSINIYTRGRMECQSNYIECRSGRNSCSIDYPVFAINGKQVNTIQEDPLESQSSSSSLSISITTLITITTLTIFSFLL